MSKGFQMSELSTNATILKRYTATISYMKDIAPCDIVYTKVFTDFPTDKMPTMMCNGREYVINPFTIDCKPDDLQKLLTDGDIIEIGAYSDGEKVYFLEINLHRIMNDFLYK